MIITVTLNPAVDKTLIVPNFTANAVNRVEELFLDPGGKGINVSKSIQALGGDSVCMGILGGDTGAYIKSALDKMGIKNDMVLSKDPTRTNTKIVDLVCGTNTDINEPGFPVSQEMLQMLLEKLLCTAQAGDYVVIAGKNPPGTPEGLLAQWTKMLTAQGVRVCLDTVGIPMQLALQACPYIIKPNREELSELIGERLETDCDIITAARALIQKGVSLVAVSLGGEGAIFVTESDVVIARCPKVNVVSTVGAGDAMMAALVYYSQQGISLEQLAEKATAVATATVLVPGSRPASMEQITPLLTKIILEKR